MKESTFTKGLKVGRGSIDRYLEQLSLGDLLALAPYLKGISEHDLTELKLYSSIEYLLGKRDIKIKDLPPHLKVTLMRIIANNKDLLVSTRELEAEEIPVGYEEE